MVRADSYGVYYILKSMEQGPTWEYPNFCV
jgi:hypothetical protein